MSLIAADMHNTVKEPQREYLYSIVFPYSPAFLPPAILFPAGELLPMQPDVFSKSGMMTLLKTMMTGITDRGMMAYLALVSRFIGSGIDMYNLKGMWPDNKTEVKKLRWGRDEYCFAGHNMSSRTATLEFINDEENVCYWFWMQLHRSMAVELSWEEGLNVPGSFAGSSSVSVTNGKHDAAFGIEIRQFKNDKRAISRAVRLFNVMVNGVSLTVPDKGSNTFSKVLVDICWDGHMPVIPSVVEQLAEGATTALGFTEAKHSSWRSSNGVKNFTHGSSLADLALDAEAFIHAGLEALTEGNVGEMSKAAEAYPTMNENSSQAVSLDPQKVPDWVNH